MLFVRANSYDIFSIVSSVVISSQSVTGFDVLNSSQFSLKMFLKEEN